jgi:hypothetical protein
MEESDDWKLFFFLLTADCASVSIMCKGPSTQCEWHGDGSFALPNSIQPKWHRLATLPVWMDPSTAKRSLSTLQYLTQRLFMYTFSSLYVHYLKNFPDCHDLGMSDFIPLTTALFTFCAFRIFHNPSTGITTVWLLCIFPAVVCLWCSC